MSDQEWHDNLPDDLKNAPIFKPGEDGTVKSVEQVVLDLTNLTQTAGNSLRMPGPDAGAEDIAKFQSRVMEKIPGLMTLPNQEDDASMAAHFSKMGKPATADQYQVPDIEGFELGDPVALKSQAHAMHMTQKQFNAMVTGMSKDSSAAIDKQNDARAEQDATIRNEWGMAYEQNNSAVGKLLQENKLVPPELVEAHKNGNLPAGMMRFLHNLSELGAEGENFQEQGGNRDVIPTVDEAMDRLNEIEKRLFDPNMTPASPEYQSLLNKRSKLMLQAYPNAGTDANAMRA